MEFTGSSISYVPETYQQVINILILSLRNLYVGNPKKKACKHTREKIYQ